MEYTGKRVACQRLELGWKIVFACKSLFMRRNSSTSPNMTSQSAVPHLGKAPRMQSILLMCAELRGKACGLEPRVATLKS